MTLQLMTTKSAAATKASGDSRARLLGWSNTTALLQCCGDRSATAGHGAKDPNHVIQNGDRDFCLTRHGGKEGPHDSSGAGAEGEARQENPPV